MGFHFCRPWLVLFLSLSSQRSAAWTPPPTYQITPSPDGHFFQNGTGDPFFWQADTAWLLFHRLNLTEAETYLEDRAAKGFNIIAAGLTQFNIDSPNRYGDRPFVDNDPTRPNEPYWAHVDAVVELAWSRRVRVALVPAWGRHVHSPTGTAGALTAAAAPPFGHFIGARYPFLPKLLLADTNPIWANRTAVRSDYTAGGIAPAYHFQNWSSVYDELAASIIAGERTAAGSGGDNWKPLMSIHPIISGLVEDRPPWHRHSSGTGSGLHLTPANRATQTPLPTYLCLGGMLDGDGNRWS